MCARHASCCCHPASASACSFAGPAAGSYHLRTLRYGTGPEGDDYPERRLATVRVSGSALPDTPWPRSLGPLPRLERDRVAR